ncbi:unnamed protein product, partial [marine sediment metagenome]
VCMLGGSLSGLIAPQIEKNIMEKFKKNKKIYNMKKG